MEKGRVREEEVISVVARGESVKRLDSDTKEHGKKEWFCGTGV